ncbi:MAG: Hsp20/alpha crystallin family protein [Vicinamibacterales bacterium]|jgi:HSP20 family protein|nr:hypothetical protein [Acidobacteriota bacterium]MDP6373552.1 Hsp20/alpha crystallin family protein [Vicinamibacterales bacterium]MDP6610433.1 Hsp20/alpha crystallin family protein [Vicinamibacterales bacterium]HAK56036.1 hypothetical protein [Acidobacteriota bacterium]|tara:strand:- start:1606 stop:2067 length:462 start_codon:yes stop_codon:yes gene_type:complete
MLTRWNPFNELTDLHQEVDRLFGRTWGEVPIRGNEVPWVPATEVTSNKEGWQMRIALPGIEPDDVHVDLHGNTLTIKGERSETKEDKELHVSEIRYGRFERMFTLPAKVEGEKVTASFHDGMLDLRLPLAESAKPRRIEIGKGAKKIDVKKVA